MLRPTVCEFIDQNENTACTNMRRAAEPVLNTPPARLVDLLKDGLVNVPPGVP